MLSTRSLDLLLDRITALTIGVLGDLFLDRYLDIDSRLTERSLETGLDAYQVVHVRPSPGAAGTVINNLAALGVKRIVPLAVIGDDGEGHELMQCLRKTSSIDLSHVIVAPQRRTPTYTKPMLLRPETPAVELNRLDIKNRTKQPEEIEERIVTAMSGTWDELDALLVLDQVSEAECGVVTSRIRRELAALGTADPVKPVLADSRANIGSFREVWLKPNDRECALAVHGVERLDGMDGCVKELATRAGRPVFCTQGAAGILVVDPRPRPWISIRVPAYPVSGPIDTVGAGDSCNAAIACALAAGADLGEAAAFGNLVASITIKQLGTTGTASPTQIRSRWQELTRNQQV